MLKVLFFYSSVCLSLLLIQTNVMAGCNQLVITVHNQTQFTFTTDASTPDLTSGEAGGDLMLNANTSTPITLNGTATSDGSSLDNVSGQLNYYATTTRDAHFTINVDKTSCNEASASCNKTKVCCVKDDLGTCWDWLSGGSPCYRYSKSCGTATNDATNNTTTSAGGTLYFSDSIDNQPPTFSCDSLCSKNSDGTDYAGTAATTEFYVYPAFIEQLTITFPFDPKTPTAKLLKSSIYNNLNSKYLAQLGTYFSYQPVVVGEKTLVFSTLCNSANCP